jgi:hypothetical protein
MTTQSQVEFNQYFHELRTLLRRDVTQGIKLAKYKKICQSMLGKDPVAANTLLGLLSCLEHDIAAMHTYHKRAVELSESGFSLMYYAASLEKSCFWSESVRYGLMALDHEPSNPRLLDAIIGEVPLTGRFSLLKRLLPQWQQASGGAQHPYAGHFESVTGVLAGNGLLEKDLKEVLAAVGDALAETDLILQGFRHDFVTGKRDASFIHYRFLIPDEFVASYYEDLINAKLKAAHFHPRIFDAFSFSVENASVYELYDCLEKELVGAADTIRVPDPDKMKLIEELVAGVEI